MISLCVHTLPEPIVAIRAKLPLRRYLIKRLPLKNRLRIWYEIEESRINHEKPAINPAILELRLLAEA